MDKREARMHMLAAEAAGRDSACGMKFQHGTEDAAWRAANHLNRRPEVAAGERHRVEPYPCPFCSPSQFNEIFYWHVGREMTTEERKHWLLGVA